MSDLDETTETVSTAGTTRRTLVKVAAWSVPVIAAAVTAPAAQASTPPFDGLAGTWGPVTRRANGLAETTLYLTNNTDRDLALSNGLRVSPTGQFADYFSVIIQTADRAGCVPAQLFDRSFLGAAFPYTVRVAAGATFPIDVYVGISIAGGDATLSVLPNEQPDFPYSFASITLPD